MNAIDGALIVTARKSRQDQNDVLACSENRQHLSAITVAYKRKLVIVQPDGSCASQLCDVYASRLYSVSSLPLTNFETAKTKVSRVLRLVRAVLRLQQDEMTLQYKLERDLNRQRRGVEGIKRHRPSTVSCLFSYPDQLKPSSQSLSTYLSPHKTQEDFSPINTQRPQSASSSFSPTTTQEPSGNPAHVSKISPLLISNQSQDIDKVQSVQETRDSQRHETHGRQRQFIRAWFQQHAWLRVQ